MLAVWGCVKKNNDLGGDLSGKAGIHGRLFLTDPFLSKSQAQPLSDKTVKLRYAGSSDTLNYLYSLKTDADGYFTFPNLTEGKLYTVFYDEVIKNVEYFGKDSIKASTDLNAASYQLRIYAGVSPINQNGILFTVNDQNGNVAKGATINLFTSATSTGYVLGTSDGSSHTLKTDSNGHASFYTPVNTTYYALATTTVGPVMSIARQTVTPDKKVAPVTLQLQPAGGIHLETQDKSGNPIGNVSVCVFTSQELFKRDTCEASNFQLISDNFGKADKYPLPNGKYYFLGVLPLKNTTLMGRDSIVINKTTNTVILKLK